MQVILEAVEPQTICLTVALLLSYAVPWIQKDIDIHRSLVLPIYMFTLVQIQVARGRSVIDT